MYQANAKLREIAAEVGFSEFTVSNVLRKGGVAFHGQVSTRTPPEVEARILAMYADGVPLTEIVRETGAHRAHHHGSAPAQRQDAKPQGRPL